MNEIFRFIQLRPKKPKEEAAPIPLQGDTPITKEFVKAPSPTRRAALADAYLSKSAVAADKAPLGVEIRAALAELGANPDATLADLKARLPGYDKSVRARGFNEELRRLSDTLLASYFATGSFPRELGALEDIYRVLVYLSGVFEVPDGSPDRVLWLLSRPLLAPSVTTAHPTPAHGEPPREARASASDSTQVRLADAVSELSRMDRKEHLVAPGKDGAASDGKRIPFTLTATAQKRLSTSTLELIKERGIDLDTTPLEGVVEALNSGVGGLTGGGIHWPGPVIHPQPGVTLPPSPVFKLVKPAGLADLLVVKQQIKRYEAGEIAHVENVLSGEKKTRAHRQLDRTEETVTTELEITQEQQTELEIADRFELNRETSQTIKDDQQISLGLSLSGKYGPSVEFSSNFSLDSSSSKEESEKSSSRFAKDVVKRSLDRITQRTREQRTRTTIHETEETNLHELQNTGPTHSRGLYQFLDKIYEAQIFNYGIREMFDFLVPEPASFLWYVQKHPSLDVELPPPPEDLNSVAPDATFITELNAAALAAAFGATDIDGAPPLYQAISVGFKHGEDNASEQDQPHSGNRIEVQLPPGYRPLRARVRGLVITDENPVFAVAMGSQRALWKPPGGSGVSVSAGHRLHYEPELYLDLIEEPYLPSDSKLGVSVVAWETNTYAIEALIVVKRTDDALAAWQLATYKKIRGAYEEAVKQYEQKVAALKSEAEAKAERDSAQPFGAPPAQNKRTIVNELKKHCISMITEQFYDAFDAVKDGQPPQFDIQEAAAEGAYMRFFEQAFEWDQMQYIFYPYFWARKSTWIERFMKQDVDPEFLDFIRAGAARVVVPVRPGFEVAVTHFVETGKIWGGEGDVPTIHDPLYVSIVDEIRERTGAPQGELAVGDAWEARVPTALVIVRLNPELPQWERVSPDKWEWQPVGSP